MKELLYKVINYTIVLVFCWLFINTFIEESSTFYHINPWIGLVGSLIIIIIWGLLYTFLYKRKTITLKKEIIILIVFFSIIIGIQIFVCSNYAVTPSWDYGVVYENAKNFALHGDRAYVDYYYNYFSWYPNNIMLFSILSLVIKIGSVIGLEALLSCIILNILCIDFSLLFLYLLIRKKLGIKAAILSMFISICFLPLYLYSPIFYSDSLSMPFIILILYLFSFLKEGSNKYKNMALLISIGIISFIGKEIKMTVIFILLSIIIVQLLNTKFRVFCKHVTLIIIPFLIASLLFDNFIVNNKRLDFKADNEWGAIPVTHWVMMGVEDLDQDYTGHNSVGGYKGEDYDLTKSYPNSKAAAKFNVEEYFKRVNKYGFFGYINYLTKKSVNTWSDGLYYSNIKLLFNPVNSSNSLRKYIDFNNEDFNYILYFAQSTQIAFLLLLIGSSIYNIKNKYYINTDATLKLTILMIFTFLLLWENRSRYLFNMIPIFIYVMTECYTKILKHKKKNDHKEKFC